MGQGPVIALEQAVGRCFFETGMIVMRGSYRQLFEPRSVLDKADLVNAVAFYHEWIHYIQSITCSSVHYHAQKLLELSLKICASAKEGAVNNSLADEWRKIRKLIYGRVADDPIIVHEIDDERTIFFPIPERLQIGMLDIMEGVAVLESFKLATTNARPTDFIKFLDQLFGLAPNSVYCRSFSWLAAAIGEEGAYKLLAPTSFLALQTQDPSAMFVRIVDGLKALSHNQQLDYRALAERATLARALGIADGSDWLLLYADEEPAQGHVILDRCIRAAVSLLGVERLRDIGASPSSMTIDTAPALSPPVAVFSGSKNFKYLIARYAVADLADQVFMWSALVGAAERLTTLAETDVYQFCSHGAECRHFAAALCHRFYAPPMPAKSHEACKFPSVFDKWVGLDPTELWSKIGRDELSLDDLIAELERVGEANLLALVRRRRSSFVAAAGTKGYETIAWKAEATMDKVVNAMRTNKIQDLIEAKVFKAAVVNEVRGWSKDGKRPP